MRGDGWPKASENLQATGIVATSDKSASVLAAVVSGFVVARLARSLTTYCYRPGGVWGWWWDIGASARTS